MKRLKITGMILLALLTITLSFAQKGNNKGMDKLNSELNLSDDQSLELQKARTAAQARMNVIRADEKMTKAEKRAAMKEIRSDQKAVMEKVLTDEQKAKMLELRKDRKEKKSAEKGKRKGDFIELKKARAEFDSKISTEDKAEIARIKDVLKKEKGGGKMESEDRQVFKETHKADFEKLKVISEKYKPEIQALLKEKSAERKLERMGEKEGNEKHEMKQEGKRGEKGMRGKRGSRVNGFLLMDFEK